MGYSSLNHRRSRSHDPGIAEGTVTSVQAALNRRQTQAYELQTQLSSLRQKLEEVSKTNQAWKLKNKEVTNKLNFNIDALSTAENELKITKNLTLSLQDNLDKLKLELRNSNNNFENAREEADSLRRQVFEERKKIDETEIECKGLKDKQKIDDKELNLKISLLRDKEKKDSSTKEGVWGMERRNYWT